MASRDANISALVAAQMAGFEPEPLKLRVDPPHDVSQSAPDRLTPDPLDAPGEACAVDDPSSPAGDTPTLMDLAAAQITLENIAAAQRAVGDYEFGIEVARLSRANVLAARAATRFTGRRRRPGQPRGEARG